MEIEGVVAAATGTREGEVRDREGRLGLRARGLGLRGRPSGGGKVDQRPGLVACGCWAADGPRWPAGVRWGSLSALSLIFFGRRELEKRKRKRGLEIEFAHSVNFPGLIKMCLFRENRKSQIENYKFKCI